MFSLSIPARFSFRSRAGEMESVYRLSSKRSNTAYFIYSFVYRTACIFLIIKRKTKGTITSHNQG